jgi:hypothetical protein
MSGAENLGPIPWQCWDIPGFKACHTEAGHRANRAMVSVGAQPYTEIWDKHYPLMLRAEVHRCEVLHGCAQQTIDEALRRKGTSYGSSSEDILARLRADAAEDVSGRSWLPWLAVGGVAAVLWFYTRNTR